VVRMLNPGNVSTGDSIKPYIVVIPNFCLIPGASQCLYAEGQSQ
jgi:hypothetical protein